MEMSFTHLRLLVKDYRSCFVFYTQVLEFKVIWGNDSTGYAELETGETRLAIFGREEMAEVVGTNSLPLEAPCQDRTTLIFRVPDVDSAFTKLTELGIPAVTDPVDRPEWGIRTAHFRDPDGNLVEINCRLS